MTQMVGRALRGTAAGGTASAYIVSFIDSWNEHIAWVNPETLFEGNNEFVDTERDRANRDLRMIAISKIEEFARILDDAVDTTALEKVPFERRIPLGMYVFSMSGEGLYPIVTERYDKTIMIEISFYNNNILMNYASVLRKQ